MNSNRVVPYLARMNSCERTRQKPKLLYVTLDGKENSLIFHTQENEKCFQYRQKSVNLKSIVLMCIYKQNSRSDNCNTFITVKPNRGGLMISKMGKHIYRFYVNFEVKISENSFPDWTSYEILFLMIKLFDCDVTANDREKSDIPKTVFRTYKTYKMRNI
jgi:hypothetical protein